MALKDDDLKVLQERLIEIRSDYERLNQSIPEMLDIQEMLVDELDKMYSAMSEIYSYTISYENELKEMNHRLQRILKIAGNALGIKSHLDYADKYSED
ncbi:MAG: hypothetical protein ACOX5R_08750 [bacterium]|jgi:septal ring factor EnvC (AmiA/AmiB activator)